MYTTFTQKLEGETGDEEIGIIRERRRSSVGIMSEEFDNITAWEEAALFKQLALTQEDWGTILQGSECVTFMKDEVALEQGESQDKIFQIASGNCRVERYDPQKMKTEMVGYYHEREMFGETNFLLRTESLVSVVADEDNVDIYVIDRDFLEVLFEKQPGLAGKFYKFLSLIEARRIRHREIQLQKLKKLSTGSPSLSSPLSSPDTSRGPSSINNSGHTTSQSGNSSLQSSSSSVQNSTTEEEN